MCACTKMGIRKTLTKKVKGFMWRESFWAFLGECAQKWDMSPSACTKVGDAPAYVSPCALGSLLLLWTMVESCSQSSQPWDALAHDSK